MYYTLFDTDSRGHVNVKETPGGSTYSFQSLFYRTFEPIFQDKSLPYQLLPV